jgi:putative Holliday junction resolvase
MNALGRVLALDVGEKRIGVALSDPLRMLARPLTVIQHVSQAEDFARIAMLVAENTVVEIVCGYPLSLDGTEGPQGRRVRLYAEALGESVSVPIILWNETYSTLEAEEVMQMTQPRLSPRERRRWIDAVAAAVILQSYLNAQAPPPPGPSPVDKARP